MLLAPLLAAVALAAPQTLTLDEALARVASDSPDLAVARARADAADAVTRQATAAVLPIVVATGSYVHNNEEAVLSFSNLVAQFPIQLPPGTELPADVVIQPLEAWSAGATVRVPVIAPSAWADRTAASRAAKGAEASAEAANVALRASVVRASAAVAAAEGIASASERAVGLAEQHQAQVARALEAGTASKLALLQAEGDVLRRRSELAQAQADLLAAQEALGALLGVEGPVRVALPEALEAPVAPEEPPSLAAGRWMVASARSRASSANLSHLPTLSAYGTWMASTVPYPTGEDTMWRVGADLTWVLYDGGLRYGRGDKAKAEGVEAAAALQRETLRVGQQTRDAERALDVARQRLTLADQQLATASEARRLASLGMQAGTVTPLEAREAEQRAFQADVGLQAAKAQVLAATAALAAARGSTW